MATVTVSPKFQIVIPKEVRRSMGITAGEKVQVFQFDDRIEFIPVKKVREVRGIARGISTTVKRDKDRV